AVSARVRCRKSAKKVEISVFASWSWLIRSFSERLGTGEAGRCALYQSENEVRFFHLGLKILRESSHRALLAPLTGWVSRRVGGILGPTSRLLDDPGLPRGGIDPSRKMPAHGCSPLHRLIVDRRSRPAG